MRPFSPIAAIFCLIATAALMTPAMAQPSSNSAGGTNTGLTHGTAQEAEYDSSNGRTHDRHGNPNTTAKTIVSQQRHSSGQWGNDNDNEGQPFGPAPALNRHWAASPDCDSVRARSA